MDPVTLALAKAYADRKRGYAYPLTEARFFTGNTGSQSNGATTAANTLQAVPLYLPSGHVASLRMEITTGGADGIVRLGLYRGDGTLVVDAGSADATSVAVVLLSVDADIESGLYFTAFNHSASSGLANVRVSGAASNPFMPNGATTNAQCFVSTNGGVPATSMPETLSLNTMTTLATRVQVGMDA